MMLSKLLWCTEARGRQTYSCLLSYPVKHLWNRSEQLLRSSNNINCCINTDTLFMHPTTPSIMLTHMKSAPRSGSQGTDSSASGFDPRCPEVTNGLNCQRIMTGLHHLLPERNTDSDGWPVRFMCVGTLHSQSQPSDYDMRASHAPTSRLTVE